MTGDNSLLTKINLGFINNIKMWVNLDKDIYIKISEQNANTVIKYLFERYPY